MSNDDKNYKGSTFWQLMIAIPGSILGFTLIIALLAKSLHPASEVVTIGPDAIAAKIEENIKPVAVVEVAAPPVGAHVDKGGEEVVKAVCSACHAAGLMGSPKIGDKGQWGPRIAQGYETLVSHAIHGIRMMPAKGGNPDLTDGEIANAVAYMANQAGANFKAPAAGAALAESKLVAATVVATTEKPVADKAATKTAKAEPAKAMSTKAASSTKAETFVDKVAATAPNPADKAEPVKEPAKEEPVKTASAGKTGEQVYKGVCSVCHAAALMGAPKFGDKDQWAPRITQGYDTLVNHAIHGIRMMPAKGGNPGLSDEEVGRAVAYMANEGGASFKAK